MSHAAPLAQFIGGTFSASRSDRAEPDLNPSDPSDVIAQVPAGTAEDSAAAVEAGVDVTKIDPTKLLAALKKLAA